MQGPTPDRAGPGERWVLLAAGGAYRLRNENTHLVLEIGGANEAPGVQAIQWFDQATAAHQHWTFEPVGDGYLLRVGHNGLVLSVAKGSEDAGGAAVQWDYVPDIPEECWKLAPP